VRVYILLEVGVYRSILVYLQDMGMGMELVLVQGVLWSIVKLKRRRIVLLDLGGMRQRQKPKRDYYVRH